MRSWIPVLLVLGACGGSPKPRGAIGAKWGEDVEQVARRLGITCGEHRYPDGGFESCWGGPVTALERTAKRVALVGKQGKLVGVRLDFRGDCDYRETQKRVGKEFDVEYTPGAAASPYTSWSTGELVHFNECVLTVGNQEYGEYFKDGLLREGMSGVIDVMMPH